MNRDIKHLQREILNGITAKKTSIRRKCMELNSLANSHQLVLLPYQAQLEYMTQVVEERRNLLAQIHENETAGLQDQNNATGPHDDLGLSEIETASKNHHPENPDSSSSDIVPNKS